MKWSMSTDFNRRKFASLCLGTLGSVVARNSFGQQQNSQPVDPNFFHSYGDLPPNTGQVDHVVQYIRDSAPHFDIPSYAGARYQDTVPDTLDIAERAKLGIHMLT